MSDRYTCYLNLRGPDWPRLNELLQPILEEHHATVDGCRKHPELGLQPNNYEFPNVPFRHIPEELTDLLAEQPDLDVEIRWFAPPDLDGNGPFVAFWMPRKRFLKFVPQDSRGDWHCAVVDDDGKIMVRQCDVKRAIAEEIPWSDVLHPFND